MPKGIKMPVEISTTGGLNTLEGSDLIRQNIIYACRPASSLHPWSQDITVKEDAIFEIADNLTGNLFTSHIYKIFEEMNRLGIAKLPATGGIKIERNEGGETFATVKYIDLENHHTRELKIKGI